MTRKRKPMVTATLEPEQIVVEKRVDIVSVIVSQEPRERTRTFTAKPCSACEALRKPGTNFTRVFATRGNVRYCRCHYCGNTWKDSDAT